MSMSTMHWALLVSKHNTLHCTCGAGRLFFMWRYAKQSPGGYHAPFREMCNWFVVYCLKNSSRSTRPAVLEVISFGLGFPSRPEA